MIDVHPQPLEVGATTEKQQLVTHLGGDTVYYKASRDVSSTSSDGTLTAGQQLKLSSTKWFATAVSRPSDGKPGAANVSVEEKTPTINRLIPIAGVPSDSSFDYTPLDGTQAVNSLTNIEYVRINGSWVATSANGATGAQGPAGAGAPTTDAWAYAPANGFGPAASVTDWGPVFNAMLTAGIRSIGLGEHAFPFSTPITVNGQAMHAMFQGAQGRGWYPGASVEHVGARLIWKGGASPTTSGTDGAITTGTTTFTSASAPFTIPANEGSIRFNGMPITIVGAGPGGTDLKTQIVARGSNTQVTVADAASTTVSGASWSFTNWTRAIQAQGSSGVSFRDCKITYDSNAFDGILIDMRSDAVAWSARGEFYNCVVGSEAADFTNGTTVAASACRAYALVHLCGMGEHFHAKETTFGLARGLVRGMYDNNTDDAHFEGCHFINYIDGAVINPGRFWKFEKCSSEGTANGGPHMGPVFRTDGPKSIGTVITLDDFSGWDFGRDFNSVGGSITNGSTTLTVTNYSAIGTFTEDMFWKDRIVVVQGAGAGGTDLKTRIVKRLSSTTLQLKDAASTTVSNGYWFIGDGGLIYQEPGYTWDIHFSGRLMTWLSPSPAMELLGAGSLKIDEWWANGDHRLDIPGFAEFIRFNSNPAGGNKFRIDINVPDAFGSSNGSTGQATAVANWSGHNIIRINASYAFNYERQGGRRHRTWVGLHPNQGATPSVAAHSGVTLNGGVDVWGNDERGVISFASTGAGIAAGLILDMTFVDTWPSLFTTVSNQNQAPFWCNLTPCEHASNNGEGSGAAGLGLYYKFDNSVHTGIKFGIKNAIAGAGNFAFAYEIVRL